jgi:signal transduction histidine kinase
VAGRRESGSDPARRSGAWREIALLLAIAAVYFVAAKAGLRLAVVHPSATAVWPPTGIALTAILLVGYRVWPAIAIGAFLANATTAGTLATSAGIAAGNTLEGLAGAWLVNRFGGGRHALGRPGEVFKFVALAAGVSTLVSATIGVTSLAAAGFAPWREFGDIWLTWWLGDAVGALVVAPPLLLWATGSPPRPPRRRLEAIAAGALLLVTWLAYLHGIGVPNAPIEWIWLPSVVWVAYSFGQRAASTTVLAISAVTVWSTVSGLGPFVLPSPNTSLLLLQAYIGVVSVLALTLSSVVAARERTLRDLAAARDELEERVRERTLDLSTANARLREEISERERLERELVEAGEQERLRLGRDLHDDLGQLLTGIGFLSSAVEQRLAAQSRPEAGTLREIRGLVQEAVAKSRTLSLGLTPVSLEAGGLVPALRELAAMTERVFDVACSIDGDSVEIRDAAVATNLYRIAQEAISNAVRHGQGRSIDIEVSLEGERLTMTVQDDGVGVPEQLEDRGRLGIGIMKYRAEIIGGTLRVESGPRGTRVTCEVSGVTSPAPGGESPRA